MRGTRARWAAVVLAHAVVLAAAWLLLRPPSRENEDGARGLVAADA